MRKTALGVVAFLLVTPFFAAWMAYSTLQTAVGAFDGARRALVTGEGDVDDLLLTAINDAEHADDLLRDPVLRALGAATGTSDDLDAAKQLSAIARDASRLALDVWKLLEEIGGRLYVDGRIDFDAVRELRDELAGFGSDIDALRSRLAGAERGTLQRVREGFERAQRELASADNALDTTLTALDAFPDLFAEDSRRRYLITFQSPSEARGGGGLLGVFGVLTVADGRMDLADIRPNEELNARLDADEVSAPPWFVDLYGGLNAFEDVRAANPSPVFPATARVTLDMFESAYDEELDGMIAMDPILLGKLTRPLGPLQVEGWSVTIKATNARRLLLRDIYQRFPRSLERAQNAYLGRLIEAVWGRVQRGDFEISAMGAALADSAATQHLKIYSTDPEEQLVLEDIGASGDPTTKAPNVHVFVHNNFTGSKIDHYVERLQTIDVEVRADGSAHVNATLEIENTVPDDVGGMINRPVDKDLPIGLARMTTHFLVPEGATVTRTLVDGSPQRLHEGIDSGLPVRWSTLSLMPHESARLSIEYDIPASVSPTTFEFTLWPQALPFPDHYEVTVELPEGSDVQSHNFERFDGSTLNSDGALKTPRTFEVLSRR